MAVLGTWVSTRMASVLEEVQPSDKKRAYVDPMVAGIEIIIHVKVMILLI